MSDSQESWEESEIQNIWGDTGQEPGAQVLLFLLKLYFITILETMTIFASTDTCIDLPLFMI